MDLSWPVISLGDRGGLLRRRTLSVVGELSKRLSANAVAKRRFWIEIENLQQPEVVKLLFRAQNYILLSTVSERESPIRSFTVVAGVTVEANGGVRLFHNHLDLHVGVIVST